MSVQREQGLRKNDKRPIENYGKLLQNSPSRQFAAGNYPPSPSSPPKPPSPSPPPPKMPSALVNLSTQNRFSPLSRPYSQAVANLPPSPLLKTPEKSVEPSSSVVQASPPAAQSFPSHASPYTQKSVTIPITVVEFEYGQCNASPGQIADRIFPLKMHFIPEPFKTRKWYEAILVATESIELNHLDRNSKKLSCPADDEVAFSKFKILRVLTVADWDKHVLTPQAFPIEITPPSFTYFDYQAAWYNFLYLRPGANHSWFVWIRKGLDKFPLWFVKWFYYFGLTQDIFPPFANQAFNNFRQNTNFPAGTRLLQFTIKFSITWIFHWDFCFTEELPSPCPKTLARSISVKWWEKFNPALISPEKITLWLQNNNTSPGCIKPSEEHQQFLLTKSQALANLSKAKSAEEFQDALKSLNSAVSDYNHSEDDKISEDDGANNYLSQFYNLHDPSSQTLFGHEPNIARNLSQFD